MSMEKPSRKDKNQNIQVFVRLRPLNNRERDIKSLGVVEVLNGREVTVKQSPLESKLTKKFTFDKAFGPNSKQVDVYQEVVSPLIEEVLSGYNCTVFAYGQTGTGKTHTMVGESSGDSEIPWQNDPMSGIIPRSLSQLFDELRITNSEYTVRVSYLELYNEELFDLLSSSEDNSKLRIYEDVTRKGSNIVNGLEEVTVYNKNEVYKIMAKGQEKRRMASTLMNAQSSRSHTVFTIVVHMKENSSDGEELMKIGKLNLVDLAGSENISKAGSDNPARRERARECVNINQSLLTLGRVITSLVERHPHIPYRESKLTRLLQESLGGRTKTSIIATISPGHRDVEETLSTLEYANRARNIQNKPEVNQRITKHAVLKEFSEEIDRLKRDLLASRERNGVHLANETYLEMTLKIDDQHKEIQEQILYIRAIKEQKDRIESLFNELSVSLKEREEQLHNTTVTLDHTKNTLNTTKKELVQTRHETEEQKHLVTKQLETEKKLSHQARTLLDVADVTTQDVSLLLQTVEKKNSLEEKNLRVAKGFGEKSQNHRTQIKEHLNVFTDSHIQDLQNLQQVIDTHHKTQLENDLSSTQILNEILTIVNETVHLSAVAKENHIECLGDYSNGQFSELQSSGEVKCSSINVKMAAIQDLIQNLCAAREKDKQSIEQMRLFIHQWRDTSTAKVVSLKRAQSEWWEKISSHLEKVKTQHKEMSEAEMIQAKQLSDLHSQQQEDFGKDISVLKSLVMEMEKKHNNHKTDYCKVDREIFSCLTKGSESFTELLQTGNASLATKMEDVSGVVVDLDEINQTFVNDMTGMAEDYTNSVSTSSLIDNKIKDSVDDMSNTWVDIWSKHLIHSNQVKENVHTKIQSTVTNQYEDFIKFLNNCQYETNKAAKPLTINAENIQVQREENKNTFGEMKSGMISFREKMYGDLTVNDRIETDFLNKEYKTYSPTGKTPNRKEYFYPRDLAATSPHERIIRRFRSMRCGVEINSPMQECQVINLDQTIESTPLKVDFSQEYRMNGDTSINSIGNTSPCSQSLSSLANHNSESMCFLEPKAPGRVSPYISKSPSESDIYTLISDKQTKENLNRSANDKKEHTSRLKQPSSLKKILSTRNN